MDKELVFPSHHVISCVDVGDDFQCFSAKADQAAHDQLLRSPGQVLLNGAWLTFGFQHPVMLVDRFDDRGVSRDGQSKSAAFPDKTSQFALKRNLVLPNSEMRSTYCNLLPAETLAAGLWQLACEGYSQRFFYFESEKTERMFKTAAMGIEARRIDDSSRENIARVASLFVPFVAYLALIPLVTWSFRIYRKRRSK